MRYWVGVVGSRETTERLRTENETWWCAQKQAAAGDLIALYVARSKLKDLPQSQGGVVAIFEILGVGADREMDCRSFGGGMGGQILASTKVVVKERFAVSLNLVDIRRDDRLSALQFVRRSFQGTCFIASGEEFQRISCLLARLQA